MILICPLLLCPVLLMFGCRQARQAIGSLCLQSVAFGRVSKVWAVSLFTLMGNNVWHTAFGFDVPGRRSGAATVVPSIMKGVLQLLGSYWRSVSQAVGELFLNWFSLSYILFC